MATGYLTALPREPRLCSIEGCGRKHMGKGLCHLHYVRQYRYGSTDDPRPNAAVRFWSKVDKSAGDDGCWIWTAKRNWMGYGNFWFERRGWMAHRWVYEQVHGPVSSDLEIDHLCRNRACVNPAHLEAVSGRENILRGTGKAAVNARKTSCVRGHPFDAVNTGRIKGGGRYCMECKRIANRAWLAQRAK